MKSLLFVLYYISFRFGFGSSSIDNHNCRVSSGPCKNKNNVDTRSDDVGWYFAGPTTYISQFDKKTPESKRLASAGAVQNIVSRRSNNGDNDDTAWFIGSVNGGVWMTKSLNNTRK